MPTAVGFAFSLKMTRDPEQMKRLGAAIYSTIMEQNASGSEVVIDTSMVFDVLMSVGGTLIAGDPQFATPQGIRRFSEAHAKQMRRLIKSARDDPNRKLAFDAEIAGSRQ